MAQQKGQPVPGKIGGLNKHEIDTLKRKHGKITLVTTANEKGEPIHLFFKKPNMVTLSASAKIAQQDPIESVLVFGRNCLVHGDPEVFEDVDLVSTLTEPIMELIEKREVAVKNL